METKPNVNPHELAKFAGLAPRWWDPHGEMKPLHEINPLRLNFIDARACLHGKRALDVGCGGGLLTEAMVARGADVTGIDPNSALIGVAKLHQLESGKTVQYQCTTAEEFAAEHAGQFDIVTCMEMLEHVPDPGAVIAACAQLAKPGGHVFLSTLNRNPKSFLMAIVGAEYVLRMLPRGTHNYGDFIRPRELAAWLRSAGLRLRELKGIFYNPLFKSYGISDDLDVNYLAHAIRD
jgi:2-polyprenyl-6-hydroxyphenyl methylase/3-demethylubiquinone-9 3-methyltransferase